MPAEQSSGPPSHRPMPPQPFALRPSPLPEALAGLRMVWLQSVERKGSPVVALISLPLPMLKTVDVPFMPRVEIPHPGVLDDPRVAYTADKRIPDMIDHGSPAPAVVDIAVVVKTHGNVSVASSPAPPNRLPPGIPESVGSKPKHEPSGDSPLEPGAEAIGHKRADPHRTKVGWVGPPRAVLGCGGREKFL